MEEMWLARDKDNELFLFIGEKPYKSGEIWYCHNPNARCFLIKGKYPNVKWSDVEPTKVKLVIDK